MNILGIETSCDETAAAVVADGKHILSNIVASQIDLHAQYGGVIPELAARSHIGEIVPVVALALKEAKLNWGQIDGIAVTAGPGLLGSLMIGTLTAATLAEIKHIPLYGVDHVEAHAYANFLDTKRPPAFPLLALIVSGGHTQLVLFKKHLDYTVLGQTRDDAAGEAFDKVAKLLDLGYPGGPAIAKSALGANEAAYALPKPKLDSNYDFSFSGLKTAVLRLVQNLVGKDFTAPSAGLAKSLSKNQINDLAASFQKTVVDILVNATLSAYEQFHPQSVVIAGGVAANQRLRDELKARLPIAIEYAPMNLCTDNAAMVAALGYHLAHAGRATDPTKLKANPILSMS